MGEERRILIDAEKLLVAMGAAIGGGCGKCAENLAAMAREMGIAPEDLAAACAEGFAAKGAAFGTMKARVEAMLKAQPGRRDWGAGVQMEGLASLIRAAAFAAANTAPDVIKEVHRACVNGASEKDFRICLSIAKLVRKKAEQFSDEEVVRGTAGGRSTKPDKNR